MIFILFILLKCYYLSCFKVVPPNWWSKLALSAGSMAGELWEGRMRACGWGWCEPILVGELTYIGRYRDLYSFVVGPI